MANAYTGLKTHGYKAEYFEQPENETPEARVARRKKNLAVNNAKYNEFKADALETVGLLNHPKAQKAWDLAWDFSHSDGYAQVLDTLEELADLLKD